MANFSIYIHIPYCKRRCPYCDFNTYVVSSIPERQYVTALLRELELRAQQPEWSARRVSSIFFGGGTPSTFSPNSFRRILFFIGRLFTLEPNAEVTIEANPGTVTPDILRALKESGINRISFGAQSLQDSLLKELGRDHSADAVRDAFRAAREVGFDNVSLDLIYGVPSQRVALLELDLIELLALNPEHISTYSLTIEKGTEFYTRYKQGALKLPPDRSVAEMMERVSKTLTEGGYRHYEISNFAKPDREAKHNMNYWHGNDYLGLGAGAHSMVNLSPSERKRWSNVALPTKYMELLSADQFAHAWSDTLDAKQVIFEFFFLGLRKLAGVSLSSFKERFGVTAFDVYPGVIELLLGKNFLIHEGDLLRLSPRGLLLADSVMENFVVDKRVSLPAFLPSSSIGTVDQKTSLS